MSEDCSLARRIRLLAMKYGPTEWSPKDTLTLSPDVTPGIDVRFLGGPEAMRSHQGPKKLRRKRKKS